MKKVSHKRGFTLMETMIALGVMTILITGFLAVFGPATGSIRRSLTVEEANRLQSTLERELSIIRPGETVEGAADSANPTSFEKAFSWISDSHTQGSPVILYNYQGDPSKARTDGTLEPFTDSGVAGKNFLVQPMARRAGDPLLKEDLKAIVGRAYFVTMTQLVEDGTAGMKVGKPGEILNPGGGGEAGTAAAFTDAVIAFEAGFQQVPTVNFDFIQAINPKDPQYLDPSFTRNLGVRR